MGLPILGRAFHTNDAAATGPIPSYGCILASPPSPAAPIQSHSAAVSSVSSQHDPYQYLR